MEPDKKPTFSDILSQQQQWTEYTDFCDQIPTILSKEIEENSRREAKLIEDLKNDPMFKKATIKNVTPNLEKAEKLLVDGNVVGVDGTMSKYRLLSGVRCQIGVVAVNYQGDQIKHSFFISQASMHDEAQGVLDRIYQRVENDDELSDMHLRGIMMYREREAGMNPKFEGKYVMYHGPLLPFELMSGLGRLRALDVTLDLLKKVVNSKRIMSVISSTSFKDYTYFGLALENGQYLTSDHYNLEHHLVNESNFLKWSQKWRDEEKQKVEDFIKDYASKISIGVIKIGDRPYVFHAHKEIFDLAAAVIARDSMFQKEKGFPLLIDYAANLCTEYFSNSQFNRMMDWQLAKTNTYLRESGERRMRVK
ncbi:MAG: hypothetical protein LDL06_02655 [Candidatus Nitrosotenuis sp.]|nr:hypothetical protein [Candidatus Nitrosotenuis sp.]